MRLVAFRAGNREQTDLRWFTSRARILFTDTRSGYQHPCEQPAVNGIVNVAVGKSVALAASYSHHCGGIVDNVGGGLKFERQIWISGEEDHPE